MSLTFLLSMVVDLTAQVTNTGKSRHESGGKFTIARVKYHGGGDWYSNPTSLPNLLNFISDKTGMPTTAVPAEVEITDNELFDYPYLYLTGHGRISFSDEEVLILRNYFAAGGFLHADDNYGLDKYLRREMKKVFPDQDFQPLPFDHPLFSSYFNFPGGCPKVHEHDNKPPQVLALFHEGRICVLYTYEADLGDGWEDSDVHKDPEETRLQALRMGTNIVYWRLSR